ncbi:hypothetical protein JTE90_001388 [Oedothorax gibbosus]|uniref:Carbohydrate sulfotransferase n=1 Tax=Oedothorax gibbosus TaxID=931172 RepID=A0AAV6VIC7_9ARAC|nr:hypothetical protein JTE90_001388 [Oedothorax gibbosus]
MDVLCRKFSRHRLLLSTSVCGVVLCLCLISVLDRWTPRNSVRGKLPQRVNDSPAFQKVVDSGDAFEEVAPSEDPQANHAQEYARRVQRVRDVCDHDEIAAMRRVWRVATNRRFGKETYCRTKLCPVIVDEKRVLFYCFIPKVASTQVKRLVSAFRSKAEPPRSEVPYFYDRYWDRIMKKLRPEGSTLDRITFREFIWYLIHTVERDYNEHWSPYWSRCDPCLVDYNFIGKLETAKQDFPYAFRQVGIESDPEWWNGAEPTHHSVTLRKTAKQDCPYAFRQVGIESDPEWWNGDEPTHHSVTLRYFQTVPDQEAVRDL